MGHMPNMIIIHVYMYMFICNKMKLLEVCFHLLWVCAFYFLFTFTAFYLESNNFSPSK